MRKHIALIYVGGGSLPGIPARDLTVEEAKEYNRELLLASGLYKEKIADKRRSGASENKLLTKESEDKNARD